MKKLALPLLLLFCMTSCQEESAVDIVNKSLEFHGGIQAWKSSEAISYQKEEWLYYDNDSLESYTKRIYTHSLSNDLPIKMEWSSDSTTLYVENSEAGLNANFELSDDEAKSYESALKAAPYTLCQPYKLLEDAADLKRLDDDKLEDTEVYTVAIDYVNEDGSPGNSWRYYFNKETYRLEGAFVKHGETYAYVRNNEYDSKTGFSLNTVRTSYRVDSLRNIQYVRGRYKYQYLNTDK